MVYAPQFALVAQWIERLRPKEKVESSTLSQGTKQLFRKTHGRPYNTLMSKDPLARKQHEKRAKEHKGFPGQHEGEDILLVFHQHPLVMRLALILGLTFILLSLMPLLAWPLSDAAMKIAIYSPLLVAAYWFYVWVGWYYSVYIVTTERLIEIKQKGFFNRKVSEYGLDKIQNVNYHIKGLQAVLFSFGTITAQTYVGDVKMDYIHKPVHIHSAIIRILRDVNTDSPPGLD